MTKSPSKPIEGSVFSKVREGILDYQVEKCPTCNSLLEDGFGIAGGGFGAYGYCTSCRKVVWKCITEGERDVSQTPTR